MSDDNRLLIAYDIYDRNDQPLTSAPLDRDWMDASPQRFAYRCLPLTIANQSGWLIPCPATFTAVWDGGLYKNSVKIEFETAGAPSKGDPFSFVVDSFAISRLAAAHDDRVSSHFGVGTLTFSIPYLFRTPPGINLWVKGPTNVIKDGVQPLEGIVETDWASATFTMNWKLTRPHNAVRFEKGEPICMIVPIARGLSENLVPVIRPLASEPDVEKEYREWLRSRSGFIDALETRQPDAVQRGWQRDYMHGMTPSGVEAPEHQTRLHLKEFTREGKAKK
jgi:hypothetical protein